MKKSFGMNLMEVLVSLSIMTIIFLPLVDVLNKAFSTEYKVRLNTASKENVEIAMYSMAAILKEASYLYTTSITIPTKTGTATADPSSNSVIALIPLYDSYGDPAYSSGYATYYGYAFTLLPASTYDSSDTSGNSVIVETYKAIYCETSPTDKVTPIGQCTTDWTTYGTTDLILKDIKPAVFSNYPYTLPIVNLGSSDQSKFYQIKLAFATKDGYTYFPSSTSTTTIDSKYIKTTDIFCRNVNI